MLRLLSLFALSALFAFAQPATTQIVGPIYDQFGNPYTGSVNISLTAKGSSAGGNAILSVVTKKTITAGAFVGSVSLAPNDTMTPAGTAYVFAFANGDQRVCTIPTSVSPVSLANPGICVEGGVPSPGTSVPLNSLIGGTVSAGVYCGIQVDNTGKLTFLSTCPGGGGGGGGGITWSTLTAAQWATLTSAQWATLTH